MFIITIIIIIIIIIIVIIIICKEQATSFSGFTWELNMGRLWQMM